MKSVRLCLLIVVGLVLLLCTPVESQFVKILGGSDQDGAEAVIQASDGGLVVTGQTWSFGAGTYYNGTLSKFDRFGTHLWTRIFDFGVAAEGVSLVQAFDGGFVVSGFVFYGGYPDYRDPSLTKFDSLGNHLWTKTIQGSTYWEGYWSLIQASDGGLVVTGTTNTFGVGGYDKYDLILAKFDSSGSFLWARTLGGPGQECGIQVIKAYDEGLVVAGGTNSFGAGGWDLLLSKFSASGNHLWSRTLGGANDDWGRSLVQTSDSGLVVTGYTFSFAGGDSCLLLAKFDVSGNLLWTRTLGRLGTDMEVTLASIIKSSDEGFVVTGITKNFGAGGRDGLLAKFNSSGDFLWARTLGGTGWDDSRSLIQASDGGFVVTGFTNSFGAGSGDILLAKFDSSGNTCLGEFVSPPVQSVSPIVTSPTPTITSPTLIITSPTPTVTSPMPTITVVCDFRPKIISVSDVGNDQGKQVRVKWNRCYYDSENSPFTITEYSIWRRIGEDKAGNMEDRMVSSDIGMFGDTRLYPPGDWDFIKTVPARGEEEYNTVCPTLGDSTEAGGMYWSVFFVSAMTSDPLVYFDSDPDSGYSLDNIPPLPVANLNLLRKDPTHLLLAWTAPGEYPGEQAIFSYDIRYNTVPLGADTTTWWNEATVCSGESFFTFSAGEVDSFKAVFNPIGVTSYYFAVKSKDLRPNYSLISNVTLKFKCGDANNDSKVTVSDVVYLINYLFKGGPLPEPYMFVGDVNCDGKVTVSDVVYLINYLFKGGPIPCPS